jgi:hypothetical protein
MSLLWRLREREAGVVGAFPRSAFLHSHLAQPPTPTARPETAQQAVARALAVDAKHQPAADSRQSVGPGLAGFRCTEVMKAHWGCVNALVCELIATAAFFNRL